MWKRVGKVAGWTLLIALPIVITGFLIAYVQRTVCVAEMQASAAPEAVRSAVSCRLVGAALDDGVIVSNPSSASPVDIAALRVSAATMFIGSLFALIAAIVAYDGLYRKRIIEKPSRPSGLSVDLREGEGIGELIAGVGSTGARQIRIEDLKVTGDAVVISQHVSPITIGSTSAYRWTVVPSHGLRPASVKVSGTIVQGMDGKYLFNAEFKAVSGIFQLQYLNLKRD